MSVALFIARRYLWSRSRLGASGWISLVSTIAIAVVTAALVAVLSVYNGYVGLLQSHDDESFPPYIIRMQSGAPFSAEQLVPQIAAIQTIEAVSSILSSEGILQSSGQHYPVEVFGIDSVYRRVLPIERLVSDGLFVPHSEGGALPSIAIGVTLAVEGALAHVESPESALIFPRREGFINPLAPASAFVRRPVRVAGIIQSSSEEVNQRVYAEISVLREALGYDDTMVTALALSPQRSISESSLRAAVEPLLPAYCVLQNRQQQQPELTMLLRMEKIMVYVILLFVLVLAAFNLSSSLVMLMIEKEVDITLLRALGMRSYPISQIFAWVGVLTSIVGIGVGFVLGLSLSLGQQHFEMIGSGEGASYVPFPVQIVGADLFWIVVATGAISALSSYLPAVLLLRRRWQHS